MLPADSRSPSFAYDQTSYFQDAPTAQSGWRYYHEEFRLGAYSHSALGMVMLESDPSTITLYVSSSSDKYYYPNGAWLDGERLSASRGKNHDIVWDSIYEVYEYRETAVISLPVAKAIEGSCKSGGLHLRVVGDRGNREFRLTETTLQGFLSKAQDLGADIETPCFTDAD
ncbi:MAG: hypothetical protein OXG08_00230 [Gammaproteobacteria bacterium]|nr:hypothetical protein [Gammaproteobacteria bacterium]